MSGNDNLVSCSGFLVEDRTCGSLRSGGPWMSADQSETSKSRRDQTVSASRGSGSGGRCWDHDLNGYRLMQGK